MLPRAIGTAIATKLAIWDQKKKEMYCDGSNMEGELADVSNMMSS